jgi:hypothetical protein
MRPSDKAIQNLSLPQYSGIKDVFGRVLEKRNKQRVPDCTLFNWLAIKAHPLELLNEDCLIYLRLIGLVDAQRKCESDLRGQVGGPAQEFNGACGDFWAEMAAIRVLASKGYDRFRAIHAEQPDGTTSDYEAYRAEVAAHVEVKNMRANKTVVDVFDREICRLHGSNPADYAFDIRVDYPFDNLPTGGQERIIRECVSSLRSCIPLHRGVLAALGQKITPDFLAQNRQRIELLVVDHGPAAHPGFADLGEPCRTIA